MPIIAANMSIQLDAPVQCQVQIPATDRALELLPRTLIHVFFDYGAFTDPPNVSIDTFTLEYAEPEQVQEVSEQPITADSIEPEGDVTDVEPIDLPAGPEHADESEETSETGGSDEPVISLSDKRWKIFFSGEVTGYNFVKMSTKKNLILQCLDLSNYWDTCYQYQVNVASLHGNATAHFVGAGTSVFDTFFQSATSSIIDIVRRRPFSRPNLTGLMGGVVHLLERVGGVYGSRGFRGVNDFFTLAELRLHLIDMLAASEDDSSSQRLFPRRAFNSWTRREGGRLSKIASFRDMLNLVNKFIFHNVAPNPIAMYQPPVQFERTRQRTTSRVVVGETGNLRDTSEGSAYFNRAMNIRESLRRIHEYGGTVRRDGLSAQIRRLANSCRSLKDDIRSWANTNDIGGVANRLHRAGSDLLELANYMLTFEARGNTGRDGIDTPFVTYEEFFGRGSNQSKYDSALTHINAVLNEIDQDGVAERRTVSSTTEYTETVEKSGRLFSQIIRPDIFMVPPPRCNVLFPELYTRLNLSKQWLRMVTRMRLTVSDEIFGPDVLLNNIYFAPDVEVLGARLRQGRGASFGGASLRRAAYARRLMEHELLSGPIPVFERMNEVNVVAARGEGVEVRGARIPYVMRAANHQFFKHRFSPHSAQVSGVFNPFVVCGFPALIVDSHMTEEQLTLSGTRGHELLAEAQSRGWTGVVNNREFEDMPDSNLQDIWELLRETVPTQYLGLVASVQHSVNQQNAATQIAFSSVRTHRDREELLGANVIRRRNADESNEIVTSRVAALTSDPPEEGQLGPNYGIIRSVQSLDVERGEFTLFGTFEGYGPQRTQSRVEVGLSQEAQAYGPEVVTVVGSRTAIVSFAAYQIEEEVRRTVEQEVEIPLEDILRPPWMSDVWKNDRIGGVYNQFFGVGAITDPMEIGTGYTDERESGEEDADNRLRNDRVNDPVGSDGRTQQSAGMEITIERSIDLLLRSYSAIKHAGRDTGEFVRSYVWRPIANIVDILGSRDLTIDPETGDVQQGREGFHSRAFGHGEMGQNIANLIPPESNAERIIGLDAEDRRVDMERLDMRARKAERVLAYVHEITSSRALLG